MGWLTSLHAALFSAAVAALTHLNPVHAHALHHHHRFSGSPVDYSAVAAGAAASWLGVPGPGEPLLITAGILAAKNKLDIASVVLVAWVSATGGGVGGWLVGRHFGRRLLSIKGPLHQFRRDAVARGDAVFKRYPVVAIILTPSWIAGIHRVRSSLYLPVNAASAAAWAAGIGLGAYYAGPPVIDVIDDIGWAGGSALVALIVLVVGGELLRRHRARRRRASLQAPD